MITSVMTIEIKSGENSCTYGTYENCRYMKGHPNLPHKVCVVFNKDLDVNPVGGVTRLPICKEMCKVVE